MSEFTVDDLRQEPSRLNGLIASLVLSRMDDEELRREAADLLGVDAEVVRSASFDRGSGRLQVVKAEPQADAVTVTVQVRRAS